MKFRIEGNVCFATCPVGMEPRFEVYDINPDGTVNYAIFVAPKYAEEINDESTESN